MSQLQIFLTGGSGDLGTILSPQLKQRGNIPVVFDIRPPQQATAVYHPGSILDRAQLAQAMAGTNLVVHIAAWHGIHEVRGQHDAFDFWDLNVTGTVNVMETAVRLGINNIIHISSTSVDEWPGLYGSTKVIAESVVQTYAARHNLNVIILRPRAFIPYWNRDTYANYIEWARWFWKGAVHIDDVAQAVLQSIDVLTARKLPDMPVLVIDGAYDFTNDDLTHWDKDGPGSTFTRIYPQYLELAQQYDLDITRKPNKLGSVEARELIGYQPQYSLGHLLQELATHGQQGPPFP